MGRMGSDVGQSMLQMLQVKPFSGACIAAFGQFLTAAAHNYTLCMKHVFPSQLRLGCLHISC